MRYQSVNFCAQEERSPSLYPGLFIWRHPRSSWVVPFFILVLRRLPGTVLTAWCPSWRVLDVRTTHVIIYVRGWQPSPSTILASSVDGGKEIAPFVVWVGSGTRCGVYSASEAGNKPKEAETKARLSIFGGRGIPSAHTILRLAGSRPLNGSAKCTCIRESVTSSLL